MGMKKFLLLAIFLVSLSFLISSAKAQDTVCQVFINSLPYNITQNNTYYCLNTSSTNLAKTAIQFGNSSSWTIQNSTLDCLGFNIDGSDASGTYGIYLDGGKTKNNTIKNCIITDFYYGIYLNQTNNNSIINSTSNSNYYGIRLASSNNSIINSISNSNSYGIRLESSSNNTIINSISNSNTAGIALYSSSNNNTIINSTFYFNSNFGIYLFSSSNNNQIINSTLDSNARGIYLYSSSNNTIINSTFKSNARGIVLYLSSNNNTIINSIINSSNYVGILLYSSQDNLIYNNLFNNTNNFQFDAIYSNYWNTTKQSGQRIYSLGNYIGGNYWTNPEGNGYSDTCTDDDRDGFCDLPYDLLGDGTNVDYLPLSDEYSPPEITIFSPLNQSYHGSIYFIFKAISYADGSFIVRTYLNNQLDYENLNYSNNTQVSYSKFLPVGTYNFTVYAEDSNGAFSQEVIFTSLGYCGDSICQADYESNMNCFKDCGGTARQFTVGIGSVVLAFGGLMLLATAFASSPTEGKDYVFKIFIAVIGIILMVYGIIYLINL